MLGNSSSCIHTTAAGAATLRAFTMQHQPSSRPALVRKGNLSRKRSSAHRGYDGDVLEQLWEFRVVSYSHFVGLQA